MLKASIPIESKKAIILELTQFLDSIKNKETTLLAKLSKYQEHIAKADQPVVKKIKDQILRIRDLMHAIGAHDWPSNDKYVKRVHIKNRILNLYCNELTGERSFGDHPYREMLIKLAKERSTHVLKIDMEMIRRAGLDPVSLLFFTIAYNHLGTLSHMVIADINGVERTIIARTDGRPNPGKSQRYGQKPNTENIYFDYIFNEQGKESPVRYVGEGRVIIKALPETIRMNIVGRNISEIIGGDIFDGWDVKIRDVENLNDEDVIYLDEDHNYVSLLDIMETL